MAGRYIITGAQISTIKELIKERKPSRVLRVINEIYKDNFIGNSTKPVSEDVSLIKEYLSTTEE